MKTQIKVTVNDEDVLWGLEQFMRLLNKEYPGMITWREMSTTKKLKQATDSIIRAVAAQKKRKDNQ